MKSSKNTHLRLQPPSNDGEALFRVYAEILEMVLASRPLSEIFNKIALTVESLAPVKTWCAIIRQSKSPPQLEFTAAPSIPEDFISSLHNLHLQGEDGTCCKVFKTGETVIVGDVLGDPEYKGFHELALNSGIHASWTTPVFGSSGTIIAIITVFYHQARKPTEKELKQVEDLRQLISLAIEKTQAVNDLALSNQRFFSIASATNDAIWDCDFVNETLWWNDGFAKLFGHTTEEAGPSLEEWGQRIHPEDRDRVLESFSGAQFANSSHWSAEYRFLRLDGTYAHVLDKAEGIFDSKGNLVRMLGGMTDISASKIAQRQLTALNHALELLRSCNQVLIRANDEKQLLTDICRIAVEIGGFKMAWVGYAGQTKDKKIIPSARFGEELSYVDEIQISYDENHASGNGPGGKTIRSGEAVISKDIKKEDPNFFWKKIALAHGFRSIISLPLKDDDHCFGILALYSTQVYDLCEDEKQLLCELADNLAFGIIALRNEAREKTTSNAIINVAQTVSDEIGTGFYKSLVSKTVESLGADGGMIGELDDTNHSITSLCFMMNGKLCPNVNYAIRDTPCESVTTKDVCIFSQDVQELFPKDHALTQLEIEAYAGIALFSKNGNQTGKLVVFFKQPIHDSSMVSNVLTIFAERAASEMDRHKAELKIRKQASLLDKARDAIFTHDLDHHIRYWNKSAERLYGYSSQAAHGKKVQDLLHSQSDDYDIAHAYTLKHGEWIGELQQIDIHGTPITVESRWNLVRNKSEEPISILTINTDITSQKRLEQQLFRTQRLESIGTLAGGLAHDLNNVLAPISMSIELLRKSVNDTRGHELLKTIAKSSARAAEMVAQILSFARGIEGQRATTSITELILELIDMIGDTFPKNIHIDSSIDPELWSTHSDATQLHQVLLNLCVNSRDAMPDGGKLFITASNQIVHDPYTFSNPNAKNGSYICIEIEDTGEGIPKDIMGKIYDPFFTTKKLGKGSGLGLSTSLNIIKSHGGFINSYSEVGKGTRFSVYLPAIVEANTENSIPTPNEALPSGNGETILVIDDEESILKVSSEILENFGYHAITAQSGEQAITTYRRHHKKIKLIITDMMMPEMDGAETIDKLLEINPHSKFIAVSGIRANGEITRNRDKGVKFFLQKPFSTSTLLKTISAALSNDPNISKKT